MLKLSRYSPLFFIDFFHSIPYIYFDTTMFLKIIDNFKEEAMLRQAVYHRPRNNYAYFDREDCAYLMLRAGRGDLSSLELISFDKYDPESTLRREIMPLYLSDSLFDYYRITLCPPFRRVAYYFVLTDTEGEVLYYDELGFHAENKHCERDAFQLPYLNHADAVSVPAWAKSAVFYQIFPDSFAKSPSHKPAVPVPQWGSEPHITKHLGGNLRGIIEKFSYFLELGITALYFCPIFMSNSCHRYNTRDYRRIDPTLGTLEDFKELLSLCHKHGIRLILDAVFNHTCDTFPAFQDVIEKGEASPYRDWYYIRSYPVIVDQEYRYERFSFERHMPKLNTSHPETRRYLLDVAAFWTGLGIDGWRLDVANEVDLDFWRDFRKTVKSINPDAFILGEMWNDSQPYLNGDMVDSVMNYPFVTACEYYFLNREISTREFQDLITARLVCYPQPAVFAMYNLLGSHDTPRWYTLAGKDLQKVILSAVFQFCFVGMPAIYYGDEAAMEGEDFVKARRCMNFTPQGDGEALRSLYKELIAMRKSHRVFSEGDFRWVELTPQSGDAPLCFQRSLEEEHAALILNNTDQAVCLDPKELAARFPWCEALEKAARLEPRSYRILL